MLSKMMLSSANVLLLDEPTNHLDLESITAVNDGLKSFKGSIIFTSYDFEFINTIANRVIDLNQQGGLSKEVLTKNIYKKLAFYKIINEAMLPLESQKILERFLYLMFYWTAFL